MINFRWPDNGINDWVPWYTILWRLPFIPIIYIGLAISFVGITFAKGLNAGIRFWKNAT